MPLFNLLLQILRVLQHPQHPYFCQPCFQIDSLRNHLTLDQNFLFNFRIINELCISTNKLTYSYISSRQYIFSLVQQPHISKIWLKKLYQLFPKRFLKVKTPLQNTVPRSGSLTLKSIAVLTQSDFQTFGHILNMPTLTNFGNKYGPRWRHHHFCSKLEF